MSDPSIYTIGWICAIATEYQAAQLFLDKEHDEATQLSPNDNNHYTLGSIGRHNVVIAALPMGEYGTSSATAVVKDMIRSFDNIRVCLMVGIAGGAPSSRHDIRLGDIVVSVPGNGRGSVLQHDFGKQIQGQSFTLTGYLNQPPLLLLAAATGVKVKHEKRGNNFHEVITGLLDLEDNRKLRKKYGRPDLASDVLYESHIEHPPNMAGATCAVLCGNDPSKIVPRAERTEDDDNPAVHYGLIASGNQLIKNAKLRDKFATETEVLCFEMEAAGLMNQLPCIVIRGICDYADTHKNDGWQGYAAMTAAAYAKNLLSEVRADKVEREEKIATLVTSS
ncbi:hypothetical protein TWF730_001705 [Orbilia blumenaviensis]|uniref:Nucleoside phosphorylase domain-containing protein n=1 Tax=Orbilia blumenaviensis TaxID=1796055 RepID=A0AAV9UJF3_9PEZI